MRLLTRLQRKTAKNWLTEVKKGLADKYELTKPQSEQAKAIAQKRAEQESAFAHLSTDELKGALVEVATSGTSKEVNALTKILKARNKSEEKESNANAKELVKIQLKKLLIGLNKIILSRFKFQEPRKLWHLLQNPKFRKL